MPKGILSSLFDVLMIYSMHRKGAVRMNEDTVISGSVSGGRIIAACGNDCSACPRYVAHPYEKTDQEYELLKKAFFMKEQNLKEMR